MGLTISGIYFYRTVKVCNSTVIIAFQKVNKTTLVIDIGIVRVYFYRTIKVCNSTVKIALFVVSKSTIHIGNSRIRF